jgi:site-specific DNA recombinase
MERIISAYQEALVTLPQLRQRMPELHRQIHAVEAELHSLEIAAVDDARYLQLAETLTTFRGKLRARAETLDIGQRQQILRLLVKEILISNDTITIRHSLPIGSSGSGPAAMTPPDSGMIGTSSGTGYLLRSGSHQSLAGKPVHEPFSEVLADHREGRTLSGSDSELRRRFRDTQSPQGCRGAGLDAECDEPDWINSERSENPHTAG